MPECCADRGCALPTADTRGLHPLYKSGAPRRSYLRQRQPSVDPALREYPCFPSRSSFAFPDTQAYTRPSATSKPVWLSALPGEFNESTQHLLILADEEVCE